MSAYRPAALAEHLQQATFFQALDGLDGTAHVEISPDHNLSRRVVEILYDRACRLAEVPHDETGLRTNKIAAFFARQGLACRPFIGVDEAGQEQINEITHASGGGGAPAVASHFPMLGLNYVRCDPKDSPARRQGKEPSVVHELTHANQPHLSILIAKNHKMYHGVGYTIMQNGFISRSAGVTSGSYFEEGYASLQAHKYVVEELDMPNGLLDREKPLELKVEEGGVYLLPGSYLWEGDTPSHVSWSPSAHAAYGLQLLNALNPAILPTMLESRISAGGLSEFAGQVDAIRPGLYDYLNAQPYEGARLMKATHVIVDKLYGGDYQEAQAVSAEQDMNGAEGAVAA